jgi:hypothetical protein
MYAINNQGSKGMLKVVHEDEHSSANEGMMPYLNKGNNLGSLMSIVSSNSGYQNPMYQMQQRGVKMSSREKNSKVLQINT